MSQPRRAALVKQSNSARRRRRWARSGLISGSGRSSRPSLSVRDWELTSAVVFALEPLQLRRERLLDESRHRVLVRPAIEHRDSILHSHQQFAGNGHRRSFDLTTSLSGPRSPLINALAWRRGDCILRATSLPRRTYLTRIARSLGLIRVANAEQAAANNISLPICHTGLL